MQRVACDSELSRAALGLAVLLLTKYANHNYDCAWPSRETLAGKLGVNPTTVTRAVDVLDRRGYFAVQRNKGRGNTNLYYPLFEDQEKDAAPRPFPFRGRVGDGEKGEVESIKGCSHARKRVQPRTEKGAALQQEPSKEPSKESSKEPSNIMLISPLDSGSRREPPASLQGPNRGPPDRQPRVATGLTSAELNRNRAPMKDPSYWKDREEMKRVAKMTPDDRKQHWSDRLKELDPP